MLQLAAIGLKILKLNTMKTYTCKITSNQYPNGQHVTFETNEGITEVQNHAKAKGWQIVSDIYETI